MDAQVIIIGGGAIGLSTAWELAERGCRTMLLESKQIGQAASWAAAGILPPANLLTATDPMDQLRGLSQNLYPDWVGRLESVTAMDVGWRTCGGWYLADTAGEKASMLGLAGYWRELGIACDDMALPAVVQREPALAQWADGNPDALAWWVPGENQIQPPKLLEALQRACLHAGVDLRSHSPVSDLRVVDRRVEVATNAQWIGADSVIVCGGSWTGHIAKSFNLQTSVVPIRGQILLLKTTRPVLNSVVNVGHRYLVCRDDGHLLVGSCEEETGFELGNSQEVLGSLRRFADSIIAPLRKANCVDKWSGLRPMTMDGFPMIGRVPATDNLFVAAGHYRSGIHLAPATASITADLVTGKQPAIDTHAFRVGRQQSHE